MEDDDCGYETSPSLDDIFGAPLRCTENACVDWATDCADTGTCLPGSECSLDSDCTLAPYFGLGCDDSVCANFAEEGEPCDTDWQCMGNTVAGEPVYCVNKVCEATTQAGDVCEYDWHCQSDAWEEDGEGYCVDDACQVIAAAGDNCSYDSQCRDALSDGDNDDYSWQCIDVQGADSECQRTHGFGDPCFYDWDCGNAASNDGFEDDDYACMEDYTCGFYDWTGEFCYDDSYCGMSVDGRPSFCDNDNYECVVIEGIGDVCPNNADDDLCALFGAVCVLVEGNEPFGECHALSGLDEYPCYDNDDCPSEIFNTTSICVRDLADDFLGACTILTLNSECFVDGVEYDCSGELQTCDALAGTPRCEVSTSFHGEECTDDIECYPPDSTCNNTVCVDPATALGEYCESDLDCLSEAEMCLLGVCTTIFSAAEGEVCRGGQSYSGNSLLVSDWWNCAGNLDLELGFFDLAYDCRPVDTDVCGDLGTEQTCNESVDGCSWHLHSETCVQFQCVPISDGWNVGDFCSVDCFYDDCNEWESEECDSGYCSSKTFTCLEEPGEDERCNEVNQYSYEEPEAQENICAEGLLCREESGGDVFGPDSYHCTDLMDETSAYLCESHNDCVEDLGCNWWGECESLDTTACDSDSDCYDEYGYEGEPVKCLSDGVCGWASDYVPTACDTTFTTIAFVYGDDDDFLFDTVWDLDLSDDASSEVQLVTQGFCCMACTEGWDDVLPNLSPFSIDCATRELTMLPEECQADYTDYTGGTLECGTFEEDYEADEIPEDLEGDLCNLLDCGHGECIEGSCTCFDDWAGAGCTLSPTMQADLEESGIDVCDPSLNLVSCVHGTCVADTLSCDCDPTWMGPQCDISTPVTFAPTPAPTVATTAPPTTEEPTDDATDAPTDDATDEPDGTGEGTEEPTTIEFSTAPRSVSTPSAMISILLGLALAIGPLNN